jgi:hypothetical protein
MGRSHSRALTNASGPEMLGAAMANNVARNSPLRSRQHPPRIVHADDRSYRDAPSSGECLPPEVGDRQPQHAQRPGTRLHDLRIHRVVNPWDASVPGNTAASHVRISQERA